MKEFKLGQKVEILADTTSINKKGDIGVITQIHKAGPFYRVTVEGRKDISNWHNAEQMKAVD